MADLQLNNKYTRTITVVPSGSSYTWEGVEETPWISISQVGSSDEWEITVEENNTNASRAQILTVRHGDGSTTAQITVNQAGSDGVNVTPTPTPTTATTISFGAHNMIGCDTPTTDTYTYVDNGAFEVGDSVNGIGDGQYIRVVTAATGSATANIGQKFAIQDEEIMSIGSCENTISFGATGQTACDTPTTGTYTYVDNGPFEVGDTISGIADGQYIRVVTTATGSATANIGQKFAIQDGEIMSIGSCDDQPTPTPTPTQTIMQSPSSSKFVGMPTPTPSPTPSMSVSEQIIR